MFEWFNLASALASRAKRSANAAPPVLGGRIFSATMRSSSFWCALYTAPPRAPAANRLNDRVQRVEKLSAVPRGHGRRTAGFDAGFAQAAHDLPHVSAQFDIDAGNIDFITEVVGQLSAKSLKVVSMVLPGGASELDIRVEGAPYTVKFNLRGDARAEAGAFLAVKQHLERENKTPGSYIDVRVPNKAYYR